MSCNQRSEWSNDRQYGSCQSTPVHALKQWHKNTNGNVLSYNGIYRWLISIICFKLLLDDRHVCAVGNIYTIRRRYYLTMAQSTSSPLPPGQRFPASIFNRPPTSGAAAKPVPSVSVASAMVAAKPAVAKPTAPAAAKSAPTTQLTCLGTQTQICSSPACHFVNS